MRFVSSLAVQPNDRCISSGNQRLTSLQIGSPLPIAADLASDYTMSALFSSVPTSLIQDGTPPVLPVVSCSCYCYFNLVPPMLCTKIHTTMSRLMSLKKSSQKRWYSSQQEV